MALALRFAVLYYNMAVDSGEYLFQDSSSYYRIAVNLATGHGFVLERGQEPYFFREPATIYLYAAGVALHQLATGRSVPEPTYDENRWPTDPENQRIIQLIRMSQALLQALALALFYLLLRHHFKELFAFLVAAFVSLYPPVALYAQQLMRENLLLAVLMLAAYLFSSHLRRPAYWKMAAMGIAWGIAALTLQVYALFGFFLLPFLLRRGTPALLALRRWAVMGAFFLLTVLPWLHTVYAFYPDIRIARSMGCALTWDWAHLNGSMTHARNRTLGQAVPPAATDSVLATDVYAFSSSECFRRSFDGSFRRLSRQLDARYGRPSARENAKETAGKLAWFFLLPGYQYPDWSPSRSVPEHDHGDMVFVMFLSFVLGVCSIAGLLACFRRAVGIVPVYLFHLAFFWVLMSATRRAFPVVPFFVLFGIVGLLKVIQLGFPQWRFSVFRES
jgi:4-amino-4-deoxy-L-arabinose transferase-like glycosyltransferase